MSTVVGILAVIGALNVIGFLLFILMITLETWND